MGNSCGLNHKNSLKLLPEVFISFFFAVAEAAATIDENQTIIKWCGIEFN